MSMPRMSSNVKAENVRAWGKFRHAPATIEVVNLMLAGLTLGLGLATINDDYINRWVEEENPPRSDSGYLALTLTLPVFTIILSAFNLGLWRLTGLLSPLYAVIMATVLLCAWAVHGAFTINMEAGWSDFMDPNLLIPHLTFAVLPIVSYLIYMSIAAAAFDKHKHASKSQQTSTTLNGNTQAKVSTESGSSTA